jgi:hypothetical protein
MPKDRSQENFGIEEPMPGGFLAQMWGPFSRLKRWERKDGESFLMTT